MRYFRFVGGLFGVVLVVAMAAAAFADSQSLVIVFKDGHKQTVDVADVLRIDLKAPAKIIFKDGHQQDIAGADVTRIEFGTALAPLGRNHFVGKWQVGDGAGNTFRITLESNGDARKSIGASHGTWAFVDGEARISWDDGWHDAIRKVGSKHEKLAHEPGKSFSDPPDNVTEARNLEVRPI